MGQEIIRFLCFFTFLSEPESKVFAGEESESTSIQRGHLASHAWAVPSLMYAT